MWLHAIHLSRNPFFILRPDPGAITLRDLLLPFSPFSLRCRGPPSLLKLSNFRKWRNRIVHFDQTVYGAKIRQMRISRGLTQEQLAEQIGITRTYLLKIENASQVGPIELAVEFATYFNVSLDFLLLAKDYHAKDRKQSLKKVISFLSELESEL